MIPAIQKSAHEAVAIGSRDADRAREVAADLGIESAYGDYETMLAEADIDAVYQSAEERRPVAVADPN